MKKKTLAIIISTITVIAIILTITALTMLNTIAGTYRLTLIDSDNQPTVGTELLNEYNYDAILELDKDGQGTLNIYDSKIPVTYDLSAKILSIDKRPAHLDIKGNTLVLTDNGIELRFTKE